MRKSLLMLAIALSGLELLPACGSETKPLPASTSASGGTAGTGASGTGTGAEGGGGGVGLAGGGGLGGGLSNIDGDGDGYAPSAGDCDDSDPLVGPNSVEVPGNAVDEDCTGAVDDELPACDSGLAIDEADPEVAARAVELCKKSGGPHEWGVVSAKWVLGDGAEPPAVGNALANFHLGHGVLPDFGNQGPRKGAAVLALSSGTARRPNDPGYQFDFDKQYGGGEGPGFPKDVPFCDSPTNFPVRDGAALELEVRTPANAEGFRFAFNFYTREWPLFACSSGDKFIAYLSPSPGGVADGIITFDAQGNPIGVGTPLLDACTCSGGPPCVAGGKSFTCAEGPGMLMSTNYQDHAATGWLRTSAPVDPGEVVTLRFYVGDSQYGIMDSLVLIDDWQWLTDPLTVVATDAI